MNTLHILCYVALLITNYKIIGILFDAFSQRRFRLAGLGFVAWCLTQSSDILFQ